MKRILFLVLPLLMLLAVLPAAAETTPMEAMYRIVLRTDAGDETLGTAVLYGDASTLLTVAGCHAEGELYAIGADGEHRITGGTILNHTRILLMTMETPGAAEPLLASASSSPQENALIGVTADGAYVSMPVTLPRMSALDNRAELLLTAEDGLMPGAVMIGADGGVAVLVVSAHGEGEGAYTALCNVTLSALLRRVGDERESMLLEYFDVTCEKGVITADWSRAANIDAAKDMHLTVYYSIDANPFLSYATPDEGETEMAFPAVPGTRVVMWIMASAQEDAETLYPQYSEEMAVVDVPQGERFTLNNFANKHVGIAAGPGGLDTATTFLNEQPITRDIIADPDMHIYFQTEDTYQVEEEDSDHALLVTLRTPEGYALYSFGNYIFMPELCGGDLWLLDITDLFLTYEEFAGKDSVWPAGEYSVIYCIDGFEVNRLTFTLD